MASSSTATKKKKTSGVDWFAVPEAVWDYHLVPLLGLKGVCCANRSCHIFRDMWQYHIREKLIPLRVPSDVSTLCRAKDIIRYMLNQRDASILMAEMATSEDGDDNSASSSEEDGEGVESDTPPLDILLSDGLYKCDEMDVDVNGRQCSTLLIDFPIHIAGSGMGKSIIEGMIKVEGFVNARNRVILRDLSLGGSSDLSDQEFGIKSVGGLPIKLERCEISNCNDAGLWIEKCGHEALPFELIKCYVHHNRVGFATRKMSGSLRNTRFHDNNYGLMVGTHCLVHIRGEDTQFLNNTEMNCVASGRQAAIAMHVPPTIRVTIRNAQGADMDSRKGGTIFNATTPRGQGILGQLYFNAQGVKKSYRRAKYWAQLSAEQGFAESQYGLGQLYLRAEGVQQDFSLAKHWFEMAAGQGHAPARRSLALLYARGQGVPKSYTRAREMCEIAAEMGLASAQCDLGFMYARGLGAEQSWEQAKHWYEMAADKHYASAYLNLGKMYFRGDCDSAGQSFDRARQYFELAASLNDDKASQGMYNLAVMYQHGKGVVQSNERARALLKQAAERGHKQAIEELAEWNRLNHVTLQHFWENIVGGESPRKKT